MNRRLNLLKSDVCNAPAPACPPAAASLALMARQFEAGHPARGHSALVHWKSKALCCLTGALVSMSGSAVAAVVVSEAFAYTDGPLAGNNGGSGWSGAWAGEGTVAAGVASYNNPVPPLGASTRSLTSAFAPVVGEKVYLGMRFGADPTTATTGDFAGLSIFRGSGFSDADNVLFFGMPFERNQYGFAASGFDTQVSGIAANTVPSYLVAEILYNTLTNITVNLYVDPTGALGTANATYTGTVRGGDWTGIQMVNRNSRSTYDDFVISTKLTDVYSAVNAVPEPSSFALAGVALAGLWGARRRRSAD